MPVPSGSIPAPNRLPVPLPEPLEIGAEVQVLGETGTFRVAGTFRDHSITCYSTSGSGGARSFAPDRVRPVTKTGTKKRKANH